uniref:Beta/gamma crystallin 'Greek key' domain-containing protein n=1 Tax=Poecilia mexicana TaxID=48701 RepID=A0A3B3WH17_9TELE
MSQYSGKIVLYEGKCFTGRKLELCSDCDNFQDRGFMNRVNSVRVESGAFVCFDHPDFKGQQYILEHGEYPEFQRWNAHNDHMGSCRPIKMHGEHYRLEMFEGDNFAGQCVELCDDCPFLQARGLTKNSVNSMKVYGDGAYVSLTLSSMAFVLCFFLILFAGWPTTSKPASTSEAERSTAHGVNVPRFQDISHRLCGGVE